MTDHKPLPVKGYTDQPDARAAALVNEFKADEERLLRKLDALTPRNPARVILTVEQVADAEARNIYLADYAEATLVRGDPRWLAIARTHFQEGYSALVRAVFQPRRIKLPEDDPPRQPAPDEDGGSD